MSFSLEALTRVARAKRESEGPVATTQPVRAGQKVPAGLTTPVTHLEKAQVRFM